MGTVPVNGALDINKQYILPSIPGSSGQALYVPTSGRILEWKNRTPSDWNATSGETMILNKPILTSVLVEDSLLDLQLSPNNVLTANPYENKTGIGFYWNGGFPDTDSPTLFLNSPLGAYDFESYSNDGTQFGYLNYTQLALAKREIGDLYYDYYGLQYDSSTIWLTTWGLRTNHSNIIKIGNKLSLNDFHGEYISIDDYNRLFEINMTNLKLTKGTANKYYGTDANKNLVAMADPLTTVGVIDGLLNLTYSSGNLTVNPYSSKKGSEPLYPYFYDDDADVRPTFLSRTLALDGMLRVTGVDVGNGNIYVSSDNSIPIISRVGNVSDNGVVTALQLDRYLLKSNTNQSGLNGIGQSIDFHTVGFTGTDNITFTITNVFTETAQSLLALKSEVIFSTLIGEIDGFVRPVFKLKDNGGIQFNKYGVGTFTGTPTYVLAFTSIGSIIEVAYDTFATTTPPVDSGNVISLKTVTLNITETNMVIDGSTFVPPITNKPILTGATEMLDVNNGINHDIVTGFTKNGSYYDINITPMPLVSAIDVVISVIHKVV